AGINTPTPVFTLELNTNNLIYLFGNTPTYAVIDNPYSNNSPDAIISVTPNFGNAYEGTVPVPVALVYDTPGSFGTPGWMLFSLTGDPLKEGQRYNIMIIKP